MSLKRFYTKLLLLLFVATGSSLHCQEYWDNITSTYDLSVQARGEEDTLKAINLLENTIELIQKELVKIDDHESYEYEELHTYKENCYKALGELKQSILISTPIKQTTSDLKSSYSYKDLNNRLRSNWIDISHLGTLELMKKTIKDYVNKQYNLLNNSGSFKLADIDSLWFIHNDWQYAVNKYYLLWHDSLSILQEIYSQNQDSLNKSLDKQAKLMIKTTELDTKISNKGKSIENENSNKARIESMINDLEKTLDARLSVIPLSTILISRIKEVEGKNKKELLDILEKKVLDRAEEIIKGWKIVDVTSFINTEEVHNLLFVAYKEGHSLIEENYWGELQKNIKDSNNVEEVYYYKISRVDVFKYAKSDITKKNADSITSNYSENQNYHVDIFECKKEDRKLSLSRDLTLNSLRLGRREEKYILGQLDFIEDINSNYNNEINAAFVDYDLKLDELNKELSESKKQISILTNEKQELIEFKSLIVTKISELENRISHIENTNCLMNIYEESHENYKNFYETKYSFLNKPENGPAEDHPKSLKKGEIFVDMVDPIFNKFEELCGRESKTIVFQGKQDHLSTYYKFKHLFIDYKPSIEAFRILTLSSFEVEDSFNDNKALNYYLNIALKIKWNFEILPSLDIDSVNSVVWDESSNLSWKRIWFESKKENENEFGVKSDDEAIKILNTKIKEWRLPDSSELKLLGKIFLKSTPNEIRKLNKIGVLYDIQANDIKEQLPIWGSQVAFISGEEKRVGLKIFNNECKIIFEETTKGGYFILTK